MSDKPPQPANGYRRADPAATYSSRSWLYERRQILLAAATSSAALKGLYEAKKAREPQFSFGVISRKTGASKGYISDVLAGRRSLNPRYWQSFMDVFDLTSHGRQLFHLLAAKDAAKTPEEATAHGLTLDTYKKALEPEFLAVPKIKGLIFTLEVLCSFGLFGNQPTLAQLRQYFGQPLGLELGEALHQLQHMGLVAKDGERYSLLKDHINFIDSEYGMAISEYLKEGINTAYQKADTWYKDDRNAYFETTFISVKRSHYQAYLTQMRDAIHKMQADLESDQGDTMIQFNVQIFPTGGTKTTEQ